MIFVVAAVSVWILLGLCGLCACVLAGRSERAAQRLRENWQSERVCQRLAS